MKKIILLAIFMATTANIIAQDEMPTIDIVYKGTATVTIPEEIQDKVTYSIGSGGANVSIISTTTDTEYAYNVSGAATNGSLTITGAYKLTLRLNGIKLTSQSGAAIDIECGKRIAVELVDGTTNTLVDRAGGAQKAAFYFKGHAEFQGGGTLNVTGKTKHAIAAKEYIELKEDLGTINILGAVSDGFHCGNGTYGKDYFEMKGGVVNIQDVGSDCVDSDDFGSIRIKGGIISANVSTDDTDGLKADSIVSVSGGTVNLNVSGVKSNGIKASYRVTVKGGTINAVLTGDGSKAIKANKNTTKLVNNGGFFNLKDGNVEIYALGDNYIVNDDTTKCMGCSVDSTMVQSGGSMIIYAYGSDPRGYNVKGDETHEEGTWKVLKAPWKHNPYDYQYDMSSFAVIQLRGNMVNDYSNMTLGAFNGDECVGVALFQDNTYGILRIRSNSTDAEEISFRMYDYNTDKEYALRPTATSTSSITSVQFKSNDAVGTPSNPVVLSYLIGDVNIDGTVNISDASKLISIVLGKDKDFFNGNADIDDNVKLNISDVSSLINILLGK